MKKTIITLTAIALLGLAGCAVLENLGKTPENYYATTQTGGALEKRYTAQGAFAVSEQAFASGQTAFPVYKVYYPSELANSNKRYPVVVFANGSGVTYDKYEPVMRHLASWGFVVIANNDKSSWSGTSSAKSLDFMIVQNQNRQSPFFNKLDLNKVGISGHSQGGVGVINAVNNHANGNYYRAVFGASTTKHGLAEFLKWPYDISKIRVPYFAVAGTGQGDAGDGVDYNKGIAPIMSMRENYAKISAPTVMARRKNIDHGEMLYRADGYMTAWFLYTLNGDREAAKVFTGSRPEIAHNGLWQDVAIKNLR
ncbi:MAG: hypothetical protein Q4G28_03710 [Neisseria sp.]|nr:hypothetical protein [Neisseria sp.]